MSFNAKKPKLASKFNSVEQSEFPFCKAVDGNDSLVLCTICNSKLDISSGGKAYIEKHVGSLKHSKAASTVNTNKSMTSFLRSDSAMNLLQGKELTFAYHAAKHLMSTRTTECNSKLIGKLFEPKFTCGATKSSSLVQKVLHFPFFIKFWFTISWFVGHCARNQPKCRRISHETEIRRSHHRHVESQGRKDASSASPRLRWGKRCAGL